MSSRRSFRCALGLHDWQEPKPADRSATDFQSIWESFLWRCSRCPRTTVTDTNGLDPYDP